MLYKMISPYITLHNLHYFTRSHIYKVNMIDHMSMQTIEHSSFY